MAWNYSRSHLPVVLLAVLFAIWISYSRVIAFTALATGQLQEYGLEPPSEWTGEEVCMLDFCAKKDLKRTFSNSHLLASYGIAVVSIILYFVWEKGPCHHHRSTEAVYLTLSVFIIVVASEQWERSATVISSSSGAIEVRAAMQWGMAIYLMMKYCDIDEAAPTFLHQPSTTRIYAKCRTLIEGPRGLERPPMGIRVADELSREILAVVGRSQGFQEKMELAILPLFFAAFMAEELGLAYPRELSFSLSIATNVFYTVLYGFNAYWILWVLYFRQQRVGKVQHLVKSLLHADDDHALRYVLWHVPVGSLIAVGAEIVEDSIMQALMRGMLDTTSKAVIIDGLMKFGMRARHQKQVRDIILTCSGKEATEVKTLIDGSGGYQNLYKLVYEDIFDASIRNDILEHFEQEAQVAKAEAQGYVGIKVLSDVDDTLLSSGGSFPAGCDVSFPKHVVYPGCLKLYECLDSSWQPNVTSCNLVFLSARPHVYKNYAESSSYNSFRALVNAGMMHRLPTLLPGRLTSGMKAFLTFFCRKTRAWKSVGLDKYNTYNNFTKLYPDYEFVFCGDDGQGDLLAGQKMLADDQQKVLRAVVIHQVLRQGKSLTLESLEGLEEGDGLLSENGERRRLVFHKTYVGAAVDLHLNDPRLLSVAQVGKIAESAVTEFDRARLMHLDFFQTDKNLAPEEELRQDLKRAEDLLRQAGCPEEIPYLRTIDEILESAKIPLKMVSSSSGSSESECDE